MNTPKNSKYDVLVIGSGHNGLVTAALLAKKGRKVAVLEKRSTLGGLAAGDEFHPGFRSPGMLHDTTGLRRSVVEQLDLAKYGLKLRTEEAPIFSPQKDGRGLLLWRDPRRAEEEIGPHSAKDARAYKDYRAFFDRVTPVFKKVFDEMPPDVINMSFPGLWDLLKTGVSLRMLGKNDMMEVLRITPMCVADWLNEWFESDLLKATLAAPSIHHSFTGPWSPGTNINLLLAESFNELPVQGGAQALAKALIDACRGQGVEFVTDAEVQQLNIAAGAVKGVTLKGGAVVEAAQVAAACDPKQLFLNLVKPQYLTHRFEMDVRNIRTRGTVAKLHLALNAYPEIKGRPSLKAEYIRTGEYFDQIERAFDAVKYREFSKAPVFDIYIPTLEDASLAPSGKHVMSVLVHFAPHKLEGGWNEQKKEELYKASIAGLTQYMPGLESLIAGKELLTPVDLEQRFNLSGGHMFHGEHAADQLLVRPVPDCSRYSTPFKNLFLCGSGSHPGGGITGAPGSLAARTMLS